MSTFKIEDIRSLGKKSIYSFNQRMFANFSAESILNEAVVKQASETRIFDVFLSHSFNDAELILGIKKKLENYGYSVYVDWINDRQLDRTQVKAETAKILRKRMDNSKCLLYATTPSSSQSKWMPWECGYVDGKKGTSAILPLTYTGLSNYDGQEYLGIYPYITEEKIEGQEKVVLWVNEENNVYCRFSQWLDGVKPYRR